MQDQEFSNIDHDLLAHVSGGGLLGAVRKGWNATRGVREKVVDTAQDAKAWTQLRAEEFGNLPLKDKVSTLAAASGGISAPVAAAATWYNATHK